MTRLPRVLGATAALAMLACTPDPITGSEAWRATPEVRIAVLSGPDGVRVEVLDGTEPVRAEVDVADDVELWILAYRADTLRAAFPGLAAATVSEILARLAPQLGADTGEEPPQADDVLSARIGGVAANPLAYTHPTWTEWRARAAAGLDFRFQLSEQDVCGTPTLTTVATSTSIVFDGVVGIGGGRALLTATRRDVSDRTLRSYSYDPETGLQRIGVRSEQGPLKGKLAWDPPARTAWGVDADARVFRFDVDGSSAPVPPPPEAPEARHEASELSVGRDGTVLVSFPLLRIENGVSGYGASLFRLDGGRWTFARFGETGYRLVDVVRRERLITWYRCWVYMFRDPLDSSGWKQSVLDPRCSTMEIADIKALDIDDDGAIVAGDFGFVFLRDDANDTWINAGTELPRDNYRLAAAMGGGRALVGSTAGPLFFRSGVHWCPVPIPVGTTYDVVAAVPEGGAAFLLPKDTRDTVVLLELP